MTDTVSSNGTNDYSPQKHKNKTRLEKRTNYTGDPIDTIIILTISVLGFIVALAWRDAVAETFTEYFGMEESGKIKALFIYAVIVTIFTVIVIILISKIYK